MLQMDKRKISGMTIPVFLWILLIMYGSGDSALGATYISLRNFMVIMELLIILCVTILQIRVRLSNIFIYLAFSANVLLSMLLNLDFSGYSMFFVLGIGFCVAEVIPFKKFYHTFENCVLLLSIASLAGIFLFITNRNLLYSFSTLRGGGSELKNLYLTTVPLRYSAEEIRNYGIFREPAMFAIYIGLAILRELFYVEKISICRLLIFTLTMISTRSFTGYLVYVTMMCLWVLKGNWNKKKKFSVLILILIAYYMVYHFGIVEWAQERLNRSGGSAESINSRIASITVNAYIFFKNFWFGAGAIKSQKLFYEYLPLFGYETTLCSTNMITYLMASYGVIFIVIFTVGIYRVGFYANTSKYVRLGLCVTIFLLLCGETTTYSSVLYIFMFYGLSYKKEYKFRIK